MFPSGVYKPNNRVVIEPLIDDKGTYTLRQGTIDIWNPLEKRPGWITRVAELTYPNPTTKQPSLLNALSTPGTILTGSIKLIPEDQIVGINSDFAHQIVKGYYYGHFLKDKQLVSRVRAAVRRVKKHLFPQEEDLEEALQNVEIAYETAMECYKMKEVPKAMAALHFLVRGAIHRLTPDQLNILQQKYGITKTLLTNFGDIFPPCLEDLIFVPTKKKNSFK